MFQQIKKPNIFARIFDRKEKPAPRLLSVCMPMHEMKGYDGFLRQSLDILAAQTFKDFDIVISDHSKKENIKNIARAYSDRLDIKYYHNPRGPYTSAFNTNTAIKLATGRLIKILFLDDFLYTKNSLQEIVDSFDLEKDNWLVTGSEHTLDGKTFYRPFYPVYNHKIHLGENTISSPSVLTIKNDKPLLFDQRMLWLMDVDYYKRCYEKFGPPKIVNIINAVNRVGDHQASNTTATKQVRGKEYRWVLKKHKEREMLREYDRKNYNWSLRFRQYWRTKKFVIAIRAFLKKPSLLVKAPVAALFKAIGFKDVARDGIKTTFHNFLYTKAGRENGPVREGWIEETLKKIPAGSSILDAGAGELKYKSLCDHLKYTSQDFGGYDGKGTGEGLQMGNWDNSKLDIVSDIVKIPVPDGSFDAVMCFEVFEHISEPALAVKEFSRIVRRGGKVIITAPFCSTNHFAPFYYANGYSKYWYEKVLAEHGFAVDEITLNGNFFKYMGQEIRNIRGRALQYSKTNTKWWICFRIAEIIMLHALARLSKKDTGSKEVLCFGVFVVATKK